MVKQPNQPQLVLFRWRELDPPAGAPPAPLPWDPAQGVLSGPAQDAQLGVTNSGTNVQRTSERMLPVREHFDSFLVFSNGVLFGMFFEIHKLHEGW